MPKQKTALEIRIQKALDADNCQNIFVPASIDGTIATLTQDYKGEASKGEEATKA
jgi:hypothetical protein